jgi:uncharacterized protein (DUF433 family)
MTDVRGSNTIVEDTRIGVHEVIGLIVNGFSVDDVVRGFPDLTRAQVYERLAYYEDHRAEIDSLVARQICSEPRGSSSAMGRRSSGYSVSDAVLLLRSPGRDSRTYFVGRCTVRRTAGDCSPVQRKESKPPGLAERRESLLGW